MKEKIADFIDEGLDLEWNASPTGRKLTALRWAEGILSLIIEEIEKVENPCLYERDKQAAESMRQEILTLLKE